MPATWTLADLDAHPCEDGSHSHLSRTQIALYERDGAIEWLHRPLVKRDKGAVRLLCARMVTHGLSARIGAELRIAVARKLAWARVMLAEIDLVPADRMLD